MSLFRSTVFWQAAGLGFISGMRSLSSVAVLSHVLKNNPSGRLANSPLKWLQKPIVANGLKLLAAGEITGDKLPNAPNRTEAPSVAFRTLSGALVGGVLYKLNRDKLLHGALVGGAAAIAGTYAAFYLRTSADGTKVLKEPWTGFIEDALALAGGAALLKSHTPGH